MRRNLLIIITLFFGVQLMAQSVSPIVLASAGGYNVNGAFSISWTLGETIVANGVSQDGNLRLSHGFFQDLIITAVKANPESQIKVKIYPNPSSAIINIQFENPTDGEILLYLLDAQGKLVKTDRIEESTIEKNINLEDLPAGVYYLRMIKGILVNVYKVVKL